MRPPDHKGREEMRLGYDFEVWQNYGLKQTLEVDLRSHVHLLLTGASGSGKSYALKWLMENLLKENVDLLFCNFKRSEDFRFLEGYSRYFTYSECAEGVQAFYESFKLVQDSALEFSGGYHIMVFDEFPAFVMSTSMEDKKLAERYKMMIAELLMLGRSYGFGVWLVMQRPDATFLTNGARDNFHMTITLGNISKEAKSMLYSGEELPNRVYKVGEGVCYIDGIGIKEIKFPAIQNMKLLEERILTRLSEATVRERMTGGAGFT